MLRENHLVVVSKRLLPVSVTQLPHAVKGLTNCFCLKSPSLRVLGQPQCLGNSTSKPWSPLMPSGCAWCLLITVTWTPS